MQIVIDIPEEAYELLQNKGVDWLGAEHILNAVANGTPLSEHSRLVDADKVESMLKNHAKSESEAWALVELLNVLDEVPTVLEATKEEPYVKVGKETYYY